MTLPADPPPFLLNRGEARLIISVPHAGTHVPDPILRLLTPVGQKIVDTDWHVDKLYDFVKARGVTFLVATQSRTVVDLNRDPAGTKLYPGQAETTVCPTETFDGEPLYAGAPPDARDIADRVHTYWQPYHQTLRAELDRIKTLHGAAVLLDAHSIRQSVPRLFAGKLPDLNYGTNSGTAADPALVARAMAATETAGFSQVLDGRFRGGHITRHYGNPGHGIHAIQLEMAQTTYMDEAEPEPFRPDLAARLIAALQHLVEALLHA
jgi:N-formylglutamate deformylase